MMERFSYLNDVKLMRSTSQELDLAVKANFEGWAAKFGVKIIRDHADNGIYFELPLRSSIEDANQTKIFMGLDLIIKIPFLKEKSKYNTKS